MEQKNINNYLKFGYALKKKNSNLYLCYSESYPYYYLKELKVDDTYDCYLINSIKLWRTKKGVNDCINNPNHGAWYKKNNSPNVKDETLYSTDFEIIILKYQVRTIENINLTEISKEQLKECFTEERKLYELDKDYYKKYGT